MNLSYDMMFISKIMWLILVLSLNYIWIKRADAMNIGDNIYIYIYILIIFTYVVYIYIYIYIYIYVYI